MAGRTRSDKARVLLGLLAVATLLSTIPVRGLTPFALAAVPTGADAADYLIFTQAVEDDSDDEATFPGSANDLWGRVHSMNNTMSNGSDLCFYYPGRSLPFTGLYLRKRSFRRWQPQ